MKTLITIIALSISTSSFASIIKSYDSKNGCTLYRVLQTADKENFELKAGEEIYFSRNVYGLSVRDLEINFNDQYAFFDIIINVQAGLNRSLFKSKPKAYEDLNGFNSIINMVNKKISFLTSVCVNRDMKIIYFTPVNE